MRISLKAVIVGGIVDIVATYVLSIPIVAFMLVREMHDLALRSSAALAAASSDLLHEPGVRVMLFAVGVFASVLGGFVAGKLAKNDRTLNGAGSAWLCIAVGVVTLAFMIAHGSDLSERIVAVVDIPVALAAGALGGALARARTPRATAAA